MKGPEDIESYLLKIGLPFEQIGPDMWNIKAEHENLVISIAGPVVVFRTKVMDLPDGNREPLYETLLRLNTTEMVHGAFGIEGTVDRHRQRAGDREPRLQRILRGDRRLHAWR